MAALLVLVTVVAVYVQTLGGPFLWDDRLLILDAPLVERGGSLADFLRAPYWTAAGAHGPSASYYRPLVTLSFALDHSVHGENPGGYHLTNVVLHAANALLVLALVRKHGVRASTATVLAAGWALLPRLAEAVAWISGRTDLLATLFTLGALVVWKPSTSRRIVVAALLGVGLLAKESAFAGALAIGVFEWSASRAPPRERVVRTLGAIAPLAVVGVLYLALRAVVVGFGNTGDHLGALGRFRTVFEAVGTYAAMLLDAWRPRAVIGRLGATSVPAFAAGVAVTALAVALLRFRSRLEPASAGGLALFVGALVPVLHVVPIPLRTLAADRFLYLPTVGLVLAFAPSIDRFLGLARKRWGLSLALAASFAWVTFQRASVWSDEIDFWVTTYVETPRTNNAAAIELAGVYERAGLVEDALILSDRALRYDDPRRTTPAYDAALFLVRLGRYEEARSRLLALVGEGRGGRDAGVQKLLERLDGLERARHELERLDAPGSSERRAELATLVEDVPRATQAWLEVLAAPSVSRAAALNALGFLLQHGDRDALVGAASAYRARFGRMDPELATSVDLRLAELERLRRARSLVGLSGPERTREIAVPSG